MKRFLLLALTAVTIIGCGSPSIAAVLVFSPNGTYVTKTTLAAAATAADAAGKTVVVTTPQVITTAIAWPSDRELRFEKGGYITFSGAGTLIGLKEVLPEWFGANGSGGTASATTNTTAFQKAIDSLSNGGLLRIPAGRYYVNGTLTITTPIDIEGAGWSRTADQTLNTNGKGSILLYNGPDDGRALIYINGAADTIDGVHIRGIALSDQALTHNSTIGIKANIIRHSSFTDIFMENWNSCFYGVTVFMVKFDNIAMYSFNYGFNLNSEVEDCVFINCLARGYRSGSIGVLQNYYCQKNSFINCDFSNCQKGFRSLISASNNTTTFTQCVFELGGDGSDANMSNPIIGIEMQNAVNNVLSPFSALSTYIKLDGCRFLYTGTDSAKQAAAIGINVVGGSVLDVDKTTFSIGKSGYVGKAIYIASPTAFGKLVEGDNSYTAYTTPLSTAGRPPVRQVYPIYEPYISVPQTTLTPIITIPSNPNSGAAWLVTITRSSSGGVPTTFLMGLYTDAGGFASGVFTPIVTSGNFTVSVSGTPGNTLSITSDIAGMIIVEVNAIRLN